MSPERRTRLLKHILPPAFWLGVWQIAAMAVGRELLLPGPLKVLETLMGLVVTRDFWLSALATMGRVLTGLLWGTAAGTLATGTLWG